MNERDPNTTYDTPFDELGRAKPLPKPAIKGYTVVPCIILHETEKAVLVQLEIAAAEFWFPLSYTNYIYRKHGYLQQNTEFTDVIHVADWLIAKKGIIL